MKRAPTLRLDTAIAMYMPPTATYTDNSNFVDTEIGAAAKAGMIGFPKSLAKEFAARKVPANVVAPGFIETDMTQDLSDEVKSKATEFIPLKRFGAVGDIASMVSYLCSEQASFITGQTFTVDGGMVM